MIAIALSLTTPTPRVRRGLVFTEHLMGARIGARVLEREGNAVGAAARDRLDGRHTPSSRGPSRSARARRASRPASTRCRGADLTMAEISLTAAFSTVPGPEQEAIRRVLTETIEQIAQDDRTFTRARVVFTESDERCGLTAELDGVKKEGVPLQIDLEQLEDAQTSAGARAQLKEALRLYFRRVKGQAR